MNCPSHYIEKATYYFTLSSSFLSLVGSSLVIFFILYRKLFRAHAYKILLYISINDIIRAFARLVDYFLMHELLACKITVYISNTVFASNLLWSACLALTIYQIIVLEKTNFEKMHRYWFLSCSVFVSFLYTLPFITDSYVESESLFCEIKQDFVGNLWRFGIIYAPGTAIFVYITVLFCRIYRKIIVIQSQTLRSMVFDRAFIYSLIVAFFFFPLMCLRIIQIFEDSCRVDEAFEFFINFAVLQGFLNSIVFFRTGSIRKLILVGNMGFNYSLGISSDFSQKNTLEISYRSNI